MNPGGGSTRPGRPVGGLTASSLDCGGLSQQGGRDIGHVAESGRVVEPIDRHARGEVSDQGKAPAIEADGAREACDVGTAYEVGERVGGRKAVQPDRERDVGRWAAGSDDDGIEGRRRAGETAETAAADGHEALVPGGLGRPERAWIHAQGGREIGHIRITGNEG